MNQRIQLKLRKLPQALGELAHSNQFLKIAAFYSFALCLLLLGAIYVLASKPVEVLTLTPDAALYERIAVPARENAVRQVVHEYLEKRFKWEPKTVVSRLRDAQSFILPSTRKVFETSTENVIRFAQEKNVAQRVYPDSEKLVVNLDKQTVLIEGDRVTSIQGLKAVGDLKLELSFEYGPRTRKNPWGIYISKELEE